MVYNLRFFLEQATKAQMGSRGIALPFFNPLTPNDPYRGRLA